MSELCLLNAVHHKNFGLHCLDGHIVRVFFDGYPCIFSRIHAHIVDCQTIYADMFDLVLGIVAVKIRRWDTLRRHQDILEIDVGDSSSDSAAKGVQRKVNPQ